MCNKLYVYRAGGITLEQALEAFLILTGRANALCYSADTCVLASIDARVPGLRTVPANTAFEPSTVYEARLFNTTAELRWLGEPGGKGQTVVLADDPLESSMYFPTKDNIEIIDALPNQYLLWGKGTARSAAAPAGWSTLAEARVGGIDVPIAAIADGGRVVLQTREYLAVDKEHGNVFVTEERLLGFARVEGMSHE